MIDDLFVVLNLLLVLYFDHIQLNHNGHKTSTLWSKFNIETSFASTIVLSWESVLIKGFLWAFIRHKMDQFPTLLKEQLLLEISV